ncbi:DNA polymerase III subunit gamma/tau [Anaerococcus sp. NML200574]|uniref:DNA polymerase III subunit gamma/tau n=1 Tax=unclassified Anaerococcus TaxID=2614126 RepID=UPI000D0BB3D8|nr:MULTISPECIES: DNA polymerase III subunit gamma/tau [unclassified Anaerococcus]MCW6677979.1 DNA polymerase III subunit gamma/tau [Anaerococcus sp. NML200574]MCW6700646.1 DNA polymerase III subunit gamma/tau [Anaerococcus sp. NML200537]
MAKALYRQYRPKTFDEVLGQDKVVNVLKNQLINNNFSHAYLFAGERGCGKTSAAKIFAKAINCLHPKDGSPCLECENCKAIEDESTLDVVEMDAASNRRIDDIRNLKDNVIYPPSKLKYKVYIIDEAHMITREAFNALLKIMEEPPKHLVFILATTEIDKIPKTILSRVQKFEFNKIDSVKIKEQINIILKDKDIEMENEAIDLIIRKAKGAMRDALSILDQVLSFNNKIFKLKDVEFILGSVDFKKIDKLINEIIIKDQKSSLKTLTLIREDGKSNLDILEALINFYRDMMILKTTEDESIFENEERLKLIQEKIDKIDLSRILTSLDILNEYANKLRLSSNTDILLDVLILRLIDTVDTNNIESRVSKLERNRESNIIDLVNNIIENKLKNYKPVIKPIESSIEKPTLDSKDEENIPITNEKTEEKSNSKSYIRLSKDQENALIDIIVASSGTMLNTLFNQEGLNYLYIGEKLSLNIKDEFYFFFLDSKREEIEEKLRDLLEKDISFNIEVVSEHISEKTQSKNQDKTIEKLQNIFNNELIIK